MVAGVQFEDDIKWLVSALVGLINRLLRFSTCHFEPLEGSAMLLQSQARVWEFNLAPNKADFHVMLH